MSKVKIKRVKPEDIHPQAHFVKKLNYKDEIKYVITPKGCASLALTNCGIEINEIDFDRFWKQFCIHLESAKYILSDYMKE